MSMIPESPDALLTREQLAAALTEAGYPIKPKTLATKASRGGGPPYRSFGTRAIYRWGDSIAWAHERLTEPRRNTSEADLQRATGQPRATRAFDDLDAPVAWAEDRTRPALMSASTIGSSVPTLEVDSKPPGRCCSPKPGGTVK
jgi:hypothetical protein